MRPQLLTEADAALQQAVAASTAAALRAGVEVRELADPNATEQASELFATIWRTSPTAAPMSSDLMRVFGRTGNYAAGAYADGRLVGASVGFFTGETPRALHSHITGVSSDMQGRSVGFALKLYQRAWALAHGIGTVSWTVDPLVRRNVFFNLAKLGADAVDYVPEFYGRMEDGVNAKDESDRLIISWPLASDRVVAASEGRVALVDPATMASDGAVPILRVGRDGEPVRCEPTGEVLCCEIPADIIRIRAVDRPLAKAWRRALRDALCGALRDGCRLAGVSRESEYVLAREPAR